MQMRLSAFDAHRQEELPMKNTFIHFDTSDDDDEDDQPVIRPQKTCPANILETLFRTNSCVLREKKEKEADLHSRGECRPCAYFAFKKDGCRMGDDCEFCHLCDRSQVRRWTRARAKVRQAEGVLSLSQDYARGARISGA